MKKLATLAFGSALVGFSLFACTKTFESDCAVSGTCPPSGDGDGDGDGDLGGNGGDGDGDTGGSNTGGNGTGGTPTITCEDLNCEGDNSYCDEESPECVQCLENEHCTELGASFCDSGECGSCTDDEHCVHLEDTPVCDEQSGACVQCTSDTEAVLCGDFSCSSLAHTCTTTMRGIRGTCDSCESDSECAADRKCVLDHFAGEEVGYFCFLEQGTTGCGNSVQDRRPYRSVVEATSLDGELPQNFCLPPNTTTCQGIKDTQSVACSESSECGLADLDDGYCPTVGTGAGLCSYQCDGGVDCGGTLTCGDSPQHCRPPM